MELFPAYRGHNQTEVVVWLAGAVFVAGLLVYGLLSAVHLLAKKNGWAPPGFRFMRRFAPPSCLLAMVAALRFLLPVMRVSKAEELAWLNCLGVLFAAVCLMTFISGLRHWLYAQFDVNQADNLRARGIHTQLGFIERILDLLIIIAAVAFMLYQAPWGRTIGASLLASAGVASVIIGFAAQRTLANLIAGFQIAFTQPVRIGDAVVVENEWGWVEEITLTYVVVRVWDLRRLVLPITHLIEKPFQNWTRTSGQILGSVMLTVSHLAPFDEIERKLNELLDRSERWDGDARVLQVVESNERSVVLRALMTAKDSPTCWDLRCEVRRGLLEFLALEHPEALPEVRLRMLPEALGAYEMVPASGRVG